MSPRSAMSAAPVTFLPPSPSEQPEADRLPGLPHPREMLSLIGHAEQEQAFLEAYNGGKLHHAFLLTGPQGIGKATFAYRAARFLLAEGEREAEAGGMFGTSAPDSLAIPATSRITQLIANRAHPDLGVVTRGWNASTKKLRGEIAVDDMRHTTALFQKTAAFGGWRIIIVDAAEDLNRSAANAILKTLEEPPAKAMFFLISHRPQLLLPTIRSRCTTLRFDPLAEADLAQLLSAFGGGEGAEAAILARAGGSIRQALRYRDAKVSEAITLIENALALLPRRDASAIDRIGERLRAAGETSEMLEEFLNAVEDWLGRMMHQRLAAGQGPRAAEPFSECWARVQERAAKADGFNLDRRAFAIGVFEDLAALVSPPFA